MVWNLSNFIKGPRMPITGQLHLVSNGSTKIRERFENCKARVLRNMSSTIIENGRRYHFEAKKGDIVDLHYWDNIKGARPKGALNTMNPKAFEVIHYKSNKSIRELRKHDD